MGRQPTGLNQGLFSLRLPPLTPPPASPKNLDGESSTQSTSELDVHSEKTATSATAAPETSASISATTATIPASAPEARLEGDVIHISISEDGCGLAPPLPLCLVGRCDALLGAKLPAESLLRALLERGLNLMPRDQDMIAALVASGWHPPLLAGAAAAAKARHVEDRVWRDVSRICSDFAVHSCRYGVCMLSFSLLPLLFKFQIPPS